MWIEADDVRIVHDSYIQQAETDTQQGNWLRAVQYAAAAHAIAKLVADKASDTGSGRWDRYAGHDERVLHAAVAHLQEGQHAQR